MKRWLSLLLALTLLLGLCSCGGIEVNMSPSDESKAENSAPSDSSFEEPEETAFSGISIEQTETEYGLIEIPQIDDTMLDSEDVRLTNALFQSIRDWILGQIDFCKQEMGDYPFHDAAEPLCVTRYTQSGNMLSMTVKYLALYPYSALTEYNEAVSIDISTGKAMDYHDVIKAAGFTEDEVKASIRSYAGSSMFYDWEQETFYSLAAEGSLPDGLGDPSYAWQEELDSIAESYDTPALPLGEPWDDLPHYPTVYAGETGLEVSAMIPFDAGDFYGTMVRIGHNDSETMLFNPDNPSGKPFGRGAMMSDIACEIVAESLWLNDDYTDADGVQYYLSAQSMELIENDEGSEPAYIIRFYTDESYDHVATVGWYAVGVFSGNEWEMEITTGEWVQMMSGTGLLPEELLSGAMMNGALASVCNEPSRFLNWAALPRTEVDLIALASGTRYYESVGNYLLLFALEDNTLVSFKTGVMEGDGFVVKSELWSLTLNTGESVSVLLERPEVPTQAIVVSTPDDVGTYIIQYQDPDNAPQTEYITSDFAMG